MWKWFLLLWFVQWRTLLSQPVISENIRESRQLNFDECCPCHNSGRSPNDHEMFDTTMEQAATVNNCPCTSEPDSEPASSIFSPALRAVEPFTRSAKERNPKPLLDPEVGLASSVLETLREVTDQEYQEALARDAARNALRDTEYNLLEQEAIDTPRNIVNIILQPKEGLTDDAMPEASHVQETRCIHPSEMSNSFKQKKFKLSNKPLREYFPLSAPTRGNKYFDMENSPSNMQEQVIPPSKTNVLQDLRSKSDLLKMKLFSSSKNGLKGYTDLNTPSVFSRQGDCDNFYDNRASRIPNFKLGSIVDLLKASKHKSLPPLPPNMKKTGKDQENDFTFSPSNLEKYYIRNNGRRFYAPNNGKLSLLNTEQRQKSEQMAHLNEISVKDNFFETENYSTLAQSETKLIPFTEINLKNDNKILTTDDENNNNVNLFNNKRLKNTINSNNNENTDAVPSASELNIVEKSVGEIIAKENSLKKECEIDSDPITTADIDETSDDQKKTFIEETIPNIFDESINKENNEVFTKSVEVVNLKDNSGEESLCDVNDLKTGSSNIVPETNIPQENIKKLNFDNDHESNVNTESALSTTTNKVVVNDDPYNISKMNTLPNIRADILKKLQNVKKVNEKIRDKLKSNVKNALKVENIDGTIESTTLSTPISNINEDNNKKKHDISTQDLQEMSNRILNLSLSNERVVDPLAFDSKSIKSHKTNTAEKTDHHITTSELNNIEISTVSSLPMIEPTSALSYSSSKNVDEIVDTVDEMADKREDNENNDILDSISGKNLCENIAPKNLDQTELNSSNDREKEMMSEASSPFINSIPHTNGNIIVQQNPNRNVKEFLNNFKSSISDIFNNNRDMNGQNDNGYDNSNTNSLYLKNNQKYNFNEQPFSDSIKSFSKGLTESNLFNSNKNNNLNSYKAKVAIPESLDVKAIPSLINGKEERLQKSFKDNHLNEITSASNILRNSLEKPNFSRLTNYMDNSLNNYDPRLNLQIPHINTFSENLRSRTEETFRNIQESFDDLQKPQVRNQNIRVGENPKKSNIFKSLQKNDISKKLQDFNSDIIDKLSLMSRRIQGDSQSKNNKNSLNKRLKSNTKLKPQVNDNVLLKSKQTSNLKPIFINSNKKSDISKPYLTQKFEIPMSGNLKNTEHPTTLRSRLEMKPQLGKDIKRKSLKENKVTFSFTTTIRPETLKLRSNSKILDKPTPASIRSSIDLPKFSTQSKGPLQKRLELMSKLKASEPKPLASNRFTSRIALPDRKLDNSITTPSSSLEDFSVPLVDDETANLKRVLAMDNDAVGYTTDNMVLTKIRDAVKAKSNGNMNKNFLDNRINNLKSSAMADATQSASNNINTAVSSLTDKPLKENVSYKCKMVCYEDKDSK